MRHTKDCIKQQNISQMLISQSSSSGSLSNYTYDQKEAHRSIVQWLVRKNLSFLIIDDNHFKNMIQTNLQPAFKKISRQTAKRDCIKMFLKEKKDLKTFLKNNKSKFCFTSDIWHSIQGFDYMCVTIHFIDSNWILQKRILSFTIIEPPHTCANICTIIYNIL